MSARVETPEGPGVVVQTAVVDRRLTMGAWLVVRLDDGRRLLFRPDQLTVKQPKEKRKR